MSKYWQVSNPLRGCALKQHNFYHKKDAGFDAEAYLGWKLRIVPQLMRPLFPPQLTDEIVVHAIICPFLPIFYYIQNASYTTNKTIDAVLDC